MSSHVCYKDIPKADRRRLAAEVRRSNSRVRFTFSAITIGSMLVGQKVANRSGPQATFFGMNLLYGALCAGAMVFILWGIFGAAYMRREIEKRWNSS